MSGFNRYIRSISSFLHCTESERQYYADHIEKSLGEDAQSLCYEEIVHRLGTPEEWVVAQVENLDAGTIILRSVNAYRRMRRNTIIVLTICLAFIVVCLGLFIWDHNNRFVGGYYSGPVVDSYSLDIDESSPSLILSTEEVQP